MEGSWGKALLAYRGVLGSFFSVLNGLWDYALHGYARYYTTLQVSASMLHSTNIPQPSLSVSSIGISNNTPMTPLPFALPCPAVIHKS